MTRRTVKKTWDSLTVRERLIAMKALVIFERLEKTKQILYLLLVALVSFLFGFCVCYRWMF